MRRSSITPRSLADTHGYTLIELLIAMSMGIIVSLAAFYFLGFATSDVTRINERVHIDQTARASMEKIMLQLHSACVTPSITPIRAKSNETTIKFISEGSKESALTTVHEHEIIYSSTAGTLVEKSYQSIAPPTGGTAPNYTFPTAATSTTTLLNGIRQSESGGKKIAIFRYYRYYQSKDSIPTGDTSIPYGELNPAEITPTALEKTAEAENVAKVTVSFTVTPEGKESSTFNHDRPVPVEDSAIFRLAPSSESSSNPNLPCSPQT
jgi:type II secretory pathway pseudopilin PulG